MIQSSFNRIQRLNFSDSNQGFSTQQALAVLFVILPLGLILLGVIVNILMQRDWRPETNPLTTTPAETNNAKAPALAKADLPTEVAQKQKDNSTVELGASVTGAPIRLLMGSINKRENQYREFQYQLGNSTVQALANCSDQSWTSYPERQVNRPQSPATERMLSLVCGPTPLANQPSSTSVAITGSATYPGTAIVFDPPSNVRTKPGGAFLCTVESERTIPVGQAQGEWYPTSACGENGFIHGSQVRF
jgi:serine/threonine protein kinase, bacterial